tara:strand:- start:10 stop:513 length:504 start_codon:yes stop_codon:yes gene_type:complete
MKNYRLSSFKKLSKKLILWISSILLIAGSSTVVAITNSSPAKIKNKTLHNLPIKETTKSTAPPLEPLLPMPIGKIDIASSKVKNTRDPFQEPTIVISNNLDLKFRGIAKSGDSLIAMIKTEKGQQVYKVGDSLGNGFVIKSISSKNVTVDISNGSKDYRLFLHALKE